MSKELRNKVRRNSPIQSSTPSASIFLPIAMAGTSGSEDYSVEEPGSPVLAAPTREFTCLEINKAKKSTLHMICEAIEAIGTNRKGASVPAIKKWIIGNCMVDSNRLNVLINKALKKGLESGVLSRPRSTDQDASARGYFKVTKEPQTGKAKKVKSGEQTGKTKSDGTEKVRKAVNKESKPKRNKKQSASSDTEVTIIKSEKKTKKKLHLSDSEIPTGNMIDLSPVIADKRRIVLHKDKDKKPYKVENVPEKTNKTTAKLKKPAISKEPKTAKKAKEPAAEKTKVIRQPSKAEAKLLKKTTKKLAEQKIKENLPPEEYAEAEVKKVPRQPNKNASKIKIEAEKDSTFKILPRTRTAKKLNS